jgi:type II secretory pathway pseudopilin PulG
VERTRDRRRSVRRGAAGGFTLVELVTAASLMTILMLGVVEIFGIVTQTASEAEAQNFAFQQMRAFFDTLNRDLRGLTREGYFYLKLNRWYYDPTSSTWLFAANRAVTAADQHALYGLGFVSVGQWTGVWDTNPQSATAAELLYTTNVATPTDLLKVQNRDVDIRRGVLGRGVWLVNGQTSGSAGQSGDHWNTGGPCFLANLLASAGYRRVAATDWDRLTVWPWLAASKTVYGGSANAPGLTRVMASCASEFYVNLWQAHLNSSAGGWASPAFSGTPQGSTAVYWPTALRVTVVVHGPGSTEPLPAEQKRFQGYALQEVFFLGDR